MRTSIGEFLRKLRITRNGVLLKDMAMDLGVSSAFLSAVESGKKKFPSEWFTKIQEVYCLNDDELKDLKEAVAETNRMVEISLERLPLSSQKLAISFARNLDYIDKETAELFCRLLEKKK